MISYEKGRRSMEAVVSIFKKIFKLPRLIDSSGHAIAFNVLVGDTGLFIRAIVVDGGLIIHCVTLVSVGYWHRDKPFGLIGAEMKFMIEIIPMITAAALHHFLESDDRYMTYCAPEVPAHREKEFEPV